MPINSFLYPAKNVPGAYEVANSCRFNENEYLVRDKTTATNVEDFTISVWVKRSVIADKSCIISSWGGDSNNTGSIYFTDGDKLTFEAQTSSSYSANGGVRKITTQVFRDVSSWSHLVFQKDDGVYKIYHNGTEITDFDTNTQSSGTNVFNNASGNTTIGLENLASAGHPFKGYITEAVLIDGQALAPTSFGEFDEDSPTIWKPKNVSGLTFGNNGFYLDFEDSSNLGNDASGGTDFTSNNLAATDQSTDTCTNNFCTLNPLSFTEGTLSEGNLEIDQNGSAGRFCASTFQVTKGKWYYEAKILNYGSDPRPSLGVGRNEETYTGNAHQGASSIVYGLENAAVFKGNTSVFDHNSSPSSGDIYGVAFDLDNLKIYFHKNGTYFNSGDPANGTGNVTTLVSGTDYSPITGALNTNSNSVRNNDWQFNFGSPMYSISSGNSDANGHGNFEYTVPSGFFSLCSKNLAEFG